MEVLQESAELLRSGLTVLRNLARFHSFDFLLETVDWLLEAAPTA